jgi:hypothetical protein
MTPATSRGKDYALRALLQRRKINETRTRINNADLIAGSPMYFDCISCGGLITVPEDWLTRPSMCAECEALKELGWLDR